MKALILKGCGAFAAVFFCFSTIYASFTITGGPFKSVAVSQEETITYTIINNNTRNNYPNGIQDDIKLDLDTVPVYVDYKADSSCSDPIGVKGAPHDYCTVKLTLKGAKALGTNNGFLVVSDEHGVNTQKKVTINVIAPSLAITSPDPASIVPLGTAQIVVTNNSHPDTSIATAAGITFTNLHDVTADNITSDTCATAPGPGQSCTVTLTATKDATGTYEGLTVKGPSTGTATLGKLDVIKPELKIVAPDPADLTILSGATGTITVGYKEAPAPGETAVNVNLQDLNKYPDIEKATACTIAAGQTSCDVKVKIKEGAKATVNPYQNLTINGDNTESTTLQKLAVADVPLTLSADTIHVKPGDATGFDLTITNTASATEDPEANATNVKIHGLKKEWLINQDHSACSSVAPGKPCVIKITAEPGAPMGDYTTGLTVAGDNTEVKTIKDLHVDGLNLTVGTPIAVVMPGATANIQIHNDSQDASAININFKNPAAGLVPTPIAVLKKDAPGFIVLENKTGKIHHYVKGDPELTIHGDNTEEAYLTDLYVGGLPITVKADDQAINILPGSSATITVNNTTTKDDGITATKITAHDLPVGVTASYCSAEPAEPAEPAGSCQVKLTADEIKAVPGDSTLKIQGTNTQVAADGVELNVGPALQPSNTDLQFSEPQEQSFTLKNLNQFDVSSISVKAADAVHNLTIDASDCINKDKLSKGESCVVKVTTGKTSYGNGPLTISYKLGTETATRSLAINAGVTQPTLTVTDKAGKIVSGDIMLDPKATTTDFTVDSAPFVWQAPKLESGGDTHGWTPTLHDCAASDTGTSCTLTFTKSASNHKEAAGTIKLKGTNIAEVDKDVFVDYGDIEILPAAGEQYNHLQYRALEVKNTSADGVAYSIAPVDLSSPALTGKVTECTGDCPKNFNTDNSCMGKADLGAGGTCRIWLQAKTSDKLAAAKDTITVTATATSGTPPKVYNRTFEVNYANSLYAGGVFDKAGSSVTGAGNIASWDGTDWHPLTSAGAPASGVTGNDVAIHALKIYQGDLYVGGKFTGASGVNTSGIAKWSGDQWHDLAGGVIAGSGLGYPEYTNTVYALATYKESESAPEKLYIGGSFGVAGEVVDVNNIASWDGTQSQWAKLGLGFFDGKFHIPGYAQVLALQVFKGKLYAGGRFVVTGFAGDNANIMFWDSVAKKWKPLIGGGIYQMDDPGIFSPIKVSSFATDGDYLYVGGNFAKVGASAMTVQNLAKYDGQSWGVPGLLAVDKDFHSMAYDPATHWLYQLARQAIAFWNTQTLKYDGGVNANGPMVSSAKLGDNLYLGGAFTQTSSGVTVANIATLNVANKTWNSGNVGGGVTGASAVVNALLIAPSVTIKVAS